MKILFLSPGYPSEMPHFVRGLAEVGARVMGVGDQPAEALPELARQHLAAYLQLPSLWDEPAVEAAVLAWAAADGVERVECLWEPGIVLAARLREALGVAGLGVESALRFRNKELMKQTLDAAGIRTPRHCPAASVAEVWAAAERIGFPIIVKPIAGAGSADTYRVDDADALRGVLPRLRHVPEVSVEEFVDGEEYTYDTISIGGEPAFHSIAWYRPRPLVARSEEWISPQVICLRDPDLPQLAGGVAMGRDVLRALGFGTGFTHMEWYRKRDGEVVFGEIGARPPGAHQVDQMNYACDLDVFRGWGEAVCHGRFSEAVARRYHVATVFKRAQGVGRIREIVGLEKLRRRCGAAIVWENLLPVGAARRDWRQTLVSDGFVVLRHPDLSTTLAMADAFGTDLCLYAS